MMIFKIYKDLRLARFYAKKIKELSISGGMALDHAFRGDHAFVAKFNIAIMLRRSSCFHHHAFAAHSAHFDFGRSPHL